MDFQKLASELLARSESLCEEWFPAGKKRGHEFHIGNLYGSPGDSLRINLNTGLWKDFASGEAGGDLIALYAAMESVSMGEAYKQLTNGHAPAVMSRPAPPAKKKPVETNLKILRPVPESAEPPSMIHPVFGSPVCHWHYRNADGDTLGYVARYEPKGERKQIVPFVWADGKGWVMKQWPDPRPLYGLELLAEYPDRPVLLTEGEKDADAARELAGHIYVVMTWPGGSNAWKKADFSVLAGRKVLLWPDADDAGRKCVAEIGIHLLDIAAEVKALRVEGDTGDGAADFKGTWGDFRKWASERVTVMEKPAPVKPVVDDRSVSVIDMDTGEIISDSHSSVVQLAANGYAPEYSDSDLAIRFISNASGDVLWCETWGRWMIWQGNRWVRDETLLVGDMVRQSCMRTATELLGRMDSDAGEKQRIRQANQLSSYRTIQAVDKLARMDRRAATHPGEWDADLWLLNTPDCVVDLRDGSRRPHRREDKITKSTSVSPSGDCPTWRSFLDTATNGDKTLQLFLQRMCGYVLTGIVREHALFFVYGTGGNGKGTFLNTITSIMADYQQVSSAETFTEQKGDRHLTELARLVGARLVSAQETEEGKRWAESRIKSLTGGDPITANFMRQDHFTFIPQFKLVIAGNHKPAFRAVDEAIRRRLHLIPFTVSIPAEKRDPFLSEKLKAEAAGILQWMIEGCLMWQREGLAPPAIVKDHTDCYLGDEDTIAQWIDECCEVDKYAFSPSADLFKSWAEWCEGSGEFVGTKKRLTSKLEGRGFSTDRECGKRGVKGIRICNSTFENVSHASYVSRYGK